PVIRSSGQVEIDLKKYRPEALETAAGLRLKNSRCNSLPRYLPLNKASGRLIGLYLAEGSGNNKDVMWYFNARETDLAEEDRRLLWAWFRARSSIYPKPEYNPWATQTSNGILAAFFRSLGNRAPLKHIPEWATTAPPDFIDGLILGLTDGDGHYQEDGTTI